MAAMDTHCSDRLFAGRFTHPRQAARIFLHARPAGASPDHSCGPPRERLVLHRTTTGRDGDLMPIRTPPPYRRPDDRDGIPALI